MKILSKYTKSPLMALLSVILPLGGVGGFLSSCSDWDDHYENEAANSAELTLWDAIQQRSDLSDFAQVLEKTMVFRQHKKTPVSYADLLKGGRSFTLFAPVNGTFNKDSILSLVTTANGDSAVERFFIMNHLSQNLVSADGTEKNFRLLNYKNASFADNKVNNVGFRESNIHSKNGIMHVMDRQLPYMMTIYEALVALPQFKSHGEFLASYNEDEFNESASVSSGIVDGKKIYIDSVMIERNKLMDRTFMLIVPLWMMLFTVIISRRLTLKVTHIHIRGLIHLPILGVSFIPILTIHSVQLESLVAQRKDINVAMV